MNSSDKIKIAFVITSLAPGGAQMMLFKLLSLLNQKVFEPSVICLTDLTPLAESFREKGVQVESLGLARGRPDPRGVFRLSSRLREIRPLIIQTWMYHADLVGGLAACLAGRLPVIWNIRHSNLNPETDKRSTLLTAKLCARLSRRIPRRIVCCAKSAKEFHVNLGYDREKFTVIPNGFDLTAFQPNAAARRQARDELGLLPDDFVVGLAARFHPHKDHRNFILAAGLLATRFPQSKFILCGDGIDKNNLDLVALIKETGVTKNFFLLGKRTDMPSITAAFDVACSASITEAFSNTVGEAMACGVPCAVTDVGDSAAIVGETGRVVHPEDPAAMAKALESLINLGPEGREGLGRSARARIIKNFSLETVVHRYESLYQEVLSTSRAQEDEAQHERS